ncbi:MULTISPECIES: hypothetical protein [Streptomyces]|uniref:hypothetical protein n=1 Tax=Streptomyces TaxID=1883 RepID=UPI000B31936B|nr:MULTISPECIES: hypothetical protein [Streptomyces]
MPLAFVFADTTEAKVANTVALLEEAGRRYWAPRRYQTLYREAQRKARRESENRVSTLAPTGP